MIDLGIFIFFLSFSVVKNSKSVLVKNIEILTEMNI